MSIINKEYTIQVTWAGRVASSTWHLREGFGEVPNYLYMVLRFGSSGCSIWTIYTSFGNSWPADLDISVLDYLDWKIFGKKLTFLHILCGPQGLWPDWRQACAQGYIESWRHKRPNYSHKGSMKIMTIAECRELCSESCTQLKKMEKKLKIRIHQYDHKYQKALLVHI